MPRLLRDGSAALAARVRRDLIDDDEAPSPDDIACYAEVASVLRKQEKDGSFPARAVEKALGSARFAACLATLRTLDRLADMGLGGLTPASAARPSIDRAVDFLLDSQGKNGGIAGLAMSETRTGRSTTPALHLQGWAVAALCRMGFDDDPRVERAFRFLLEHRQDDGGWAWRGVRTDSAARPSSHLVTGMVLRAFAASPSRRGAREARRAGELLSTRFMQPDRYPDRKAANHWENLAEPRFYTDLLDALDATTAIGLGKENSGVRTAEAYLRSRQAPDGFWYPGAPGVRKPAGKELEATMWFTVRMLSVLRRVN